ncbi:MAG: alpha/beta hydrolase [Actinomycetota bacterium]|nr:alpha/beta hydrolase [Actinomycetota bacterium]
MNEHPWARAGLISLGVGLAVAGAGAAVGVAADRLAGGRPVLPQLGIRPGKDDEDYGEVHIPGTEVTADDGTILHVEVEEPDPAHSGGSHPPLTVVLCHGYALSMDSWHFQRKALRGRYRLVLWDQRGHGRSGTGPLGSATIDQVGSDLGAVLDAVAPAGPLVLVGHSMGGMTIMALADQRPELFTERVLGVGLVSTSAGGLSDVDFGLTPLGRLVQQLAPGTLRVLTRVPRLVEQGRRLGSEIEAVFVRHYSFGSPVSRELLRFTGAMISGTQLGVIGDFLPTFSDHDRRQALAALLGREVLVIVGDHDLMTPSSHSVAIVELLPHAEHVVVRDGGHLIMLEHPEVVTGHLTELIERSVRSLDSGHHHGRLLPSVRRTVTSLRHHRHDGAA